MDRRFILLFSCPDRIGIVAAVAGFLVEHQCNIIDSAQFGDVEAGRFFMRIAFQVGEDLTLDAIDSAFTPIAERYGMAAEFFDQARKKPTLLMVSRFGHCLNDLMFRAQTGALPIDVRAIVSNHTDFKRLADAAGVPFRHLPVTAGTKVAQEAALSDLVAETGAELIVLARYMQVLSGEFCARYPQRIINIHHSFLPSFKGAKPYHRAHERGVKLIGATAHYVTQDLDEGPIIEQEVKRVTHGMTAEDLVAAGRDVEAVTLAQAVKYHAEHRVLLNGLRTVVFQ